VENFARLYLDVERMLGALPQLLGEGIRYTLIISVGALAIGLVFGLLLALLGISRRWWVALPAKVYIDIFRGLPAILTIVLVGNGLPAAGFAIFGRNRIAYGTLALGLIATAYIAEILRAGIQSVDKGQMEAARSVGMSYLLAMRLVIVPQGIRRVLPPLTNEFIAIVKDSSLVFIIGLSMGQRELFRVGQNVSQQEGGNLSPLVAAGLCYLLITIPLTRVVNIMDKRMREGRPVAAEDDELPATAQAQN
jgi:polar amino acid transport system permease protein